MNLWKRASSSRLERGPAGSEEPDQGVEGSSKIRVAMLCAGEGDGVSLEEEHGVRAGSGEAIDARHEAGTIGSETVRSDFTEAALSLDDRRGRGASEQVVAGLKSGSGGAD